MREWLGGGLVTFDTGVGAGFFNNYKFGVQDFGGPVQILATPGVRVTHSRTPLPGFVPNTSLVPTCSDLQAGVGMYIVELGYQF